jgi:hypothetical protein
MTNARLMVAAISLLGGLGVVAAPANAQNQARALQACGAIKSKSARLDCYDRLARGAPAAQPAEAPDAAAQEAAPTAASFGRESIKRKRPRKEQQAESRITAEVVSATDNGIGHWLITLGDGAQWRMTERDDSFIPPRKGDMVTIRRSALGGYLMDAGHQVSVRVRRVD